MKAVGLDTSVVVRLLTGAPEDQARASLRYLEELHDDKREALVSDLVVAEVYFALTHHYRVPPKEAMERLADFLESGLALPDPLGHALETLNSKAVGKAGFVDRLIRSQYMAYTQEVATFDADFGKLAGVRRLKA